MDTTHHQGWRRQGLLYPMMLIAAVAVIIFSVVGIATMTGLLPNALPEYRSAPARSSDAKPPHMASGERHSSAGRQTGRHAAPPLCRECGIVASIRELERPGQDSLFGAVAGGVVGGLLGSEIGRGNGRSAATILGAGAGAYAGNEIERNVNRRTVYQVRVRMSDGRLRTFYQSVRPAFGVGEKIRLVKDGRLVAVK